VRFVKTFKDHRLSLRTIRACFMRAVELVHDERPFSTQKFRTDGKTIFLEITNDVREGELIDLKRRQGVFHTVILPSLHDLEFDADIVARWFPLGSGRRTIVVDPARAFGRPIVFEGGVPVEVLADAVAIEGGEQRVAKLYDVPLAAVARRDLVSSTARGLKLLLDNHLSPRIAHCLRALFDGDHDIVALRDKFAPNTTDVEWITALDWEGGWAVITRDLHIRTRPHERTTLDRANIVFFFLAGAWRKIPVEDTAARLIRWTPKIVAQTALAASGRFELPINPGSKLRPHRD
jgi:uncharacterized protein (DUF433 family)